MPDYYDYEKNPPKPHTCPALGEQEVTVCLPVEICPFAMAGPPKIQCWGKPTVAPCNKCRGKVNGKCEFTISQKIRIEVPVEFGAKVEIGETFVDCDFDHKPRDDYKGEGEHKCGCEV